MLLGEDFKASPTSLDTLHEQSTLNPSLGLARLGTAPGSTPWWRGGFGAAPRGPHPSPEGGGVCRKAQAHRVTLGGEEHHLCTSFRPLLLLAPHEDSREEAGTPRLGDSYCGSQSFGEHSEAICPNPFILPLGKPRCRGVIVSQILMEGQWKS